MSGLDLPRHVDTIVVGAGTGGASFAGLYARHSTESLLLLEAGPDYGSRASGNWPADLLDSRAIPLSHDWELTDARAGQRPLDLPRARVVGGCSAHNGCTISRGARLDYDDWARAGNPGWDADSVEPLLDWAHDRFRVRRYRMAELTSPQAAFVHSGLRLGLPFADDLDDLSAGIGIGPMPANIVDRTRWNAAFAFLDPVREAPHVTITGGTMVQRLILQRGSVAGVDVRRADGESQAVYAERVVVAAGAYLSPALLQRSGIGPADRLRAIGIEPALHLPGVGGHLLDHSCVQLDFHGRPELLAERAATGWHPDEQSVGRARSTHCDAGPYDIHVFMVAGANSGHPGLPPISLYGGAMRARSQGHVIVRDPAPCSRPVIEHAYATDPDGHDRGVLAEALDLLEEMANVPELAAVLGARANHDQDPLASIVSYCHPAGTCKMGPPSDPVAVVDATGAVHGLDGLYVADASIMPAITRGNINLPTAMIGARIAAGLLGLDPVAAARSGSASEQITEESRVR